MSKVKSIKSRRGRVVEISLDKIYNYITENGIVSHNCKWCKKFWFLSDGVTPKVYKLSELAANGSNMGKKTSEWAPTLGITHPNGRHYLLELPINWGFEGGKLTFKGIGHNEYEEQRS